MSEPVKPSDKSAAVEPSPLGRLALKARIAELEAEVADLKKKLAEKAGK